MVPISFRVGCVSSSCLVGFALGGAVSILQAVTQYVLQCVSQPFHHLPVILKFVLNSQNREFSEYAGASGPLVRCVSLT